jgi:very-short-patch-repair endonuclease
MYNCKTCGKQITRSPSKIKSDNIFCNHHCASIFTNTNRGSKSTFICIICSKITPCYPSQKEKKKFCSIECRKQSYNNLNILKNCKTCDKEFSCYERKKDKVNFCSGKCRNHFNNKNIYGNRSKIEKEFEEVLRNTYPTLNITTNNRTVLDGLELDFYFPDIKVAIEFNGIWHIRPIRGQDFLNKILIKDEQKKRKCEELNIILITQYDTTSSLKNRQKIIKDTLIEFKNILKV